jgi:anti-sigma regulatory factor (Ser/Thr protein kinase)
MRWKVERSPRSVSVTRRRVTEVLAAWDIPISGDFGDEVGLLVSELVANAVSHGSAPLLEIGMALSSTRRKWFFQILDCTTHEHGTRPSARAGRARHTSGEGAEFVDRVTGHRWGRTTTENEESIWRELEVPDQAPL